MRKSKLSTAEIEASEMSEAERRRNRNNGLSMMQIRDRGWARLSNGVIIEWPVDAELEEGMVRRSIPNGHFVLNFDGKSILFNADDLARYTRWV